VELGNYMDSIIAINKYAPGVAPAFMRAMTARVTFDSGEGCFAMAVELAELMKCRYPG
jgi:hypothetical protein